jgi:hypothetical protein
MPAPQWRPGTWRKSTYSDSGNGCVKVRYDATGVDLGDTKLPGGGPTLRFTFEQWDRFRDDAAAGRRSVTNGAVAVTRSPLLVDYAHGQTLTTWHVQSLDSPDVLHFTDIEWTAFQSGARDGQFAFDPAAAGRRPARRLISPTTGGARKSPGRVGVPGADVIAGAGDH